VEDEESNQDSLGKGSESKQSKRKKMSRSLYRPQFRIRRQRRLRPRQQREKPHDSAPPSTAVGDPSRLAHGGGDGDGGGCEPGFVHGEEQVTAILPYPYPHGISIPYSLEMGTSISYPLVAGMDMGSGYGYPAARGVAGAHAPHGEGNRICWARLGFDSAPADSSGRWGNGNVPNAVAVAVAFRARAVRRTPFVSATSKLSEDFPAYRFSLLVDRRSENKQDGR